MRHGVVSIGSITESKVLFRVLKAWAKATTKSIMSSPSHFPLKDRPPVAPIRILKLRTGIRLSLASAAVYNVASGN